MGNLCLQFPRLFSMLETVAVDTSRQNKNSLWVWSWMKTHPLTLCKQTLGQKRQWATRAQCKRAPQELSKLEATNCSYVPVGGRTLHHSWNWGFSKEKRCLGGETETSHWLLSAKGSKSVKQTTKTGCKSSHAVHHYQKLTQAQRWNQCWNPPKLWDPNREQASWEQTACEETWCHW